MSQDEIDKTFKTLNIEEMFLEIKEIWKIVHFVLWTIVTENVFEQKNKEKLLRESNW